MNKTKQKKVKNKNKTLKKHKNNHSYNDTHNLYKNNSDKYFLRSLTNVTKKSNIKLKDDFYSYINDKWLKENKINFYQKYINQVDDFRLIQDKVYRELLDIAKNYTTNPNTKHTERAIAIHNLYKSFYHLNNDRQSKNYAQTKLEKIDNLRKDKSNLWKLLAMINKNEIISTCAPFVWSIKGDDKNPKAYICNIEPPQMPIIDINVYFDDGKNVEYKKNYKKKYLEYLQILFDNVFGKNNEFNVMHAYNCQVKIIYAVGCNELKNDTFYNLVTKETAKKKYLFDWDEFGKELGFTHTPNEFVTSNLNYLLCGTKLLIEEWDSLEWRTYWIYIY